MGKYQLVPVSGDGACFFHSISGFLELDKNEKKMKDGKMYTYVSRNPTKSSKLRKQVVTWLRNNLDYEMPNGLTIKDEIEEEVRYRRKLSSIKDYLQDMSRERAYAGQLEITAMANILKRTIRTFIKKGNKLSNVGLGYVIDKSINYGDIHLYHNLGKTKAKGLHHFEILYPRSYATIVPKSKYDSLERVKSKTKSKPRPATKPVKKRTKRRGRRP
jgi:hypothetical protein